MDDPIYLGTCCCCGNQDAYYPVCVDCVPQGRLRPRRYRPVMSRPLDPGTWVCAWCHTRNPTTHPTCAACGRDLMTRPPREA